MSDQPISDLRRRMLADMAVRQFSDKTQDDYFHHVAAAARFLGCLPETATADALRRFQLAQVESGAQPKINTQASAMRLFFSIALGRVDLAHQLARTHCPRKLPRILSPEDVRRLLEAAPGPGLKYHAALSVAHGAWLRGGEVVMMRVVDIDSKRTLMRVEMDKGLRSAAAPAAPGAAPPMVAAVPVTRLNVPRARSGAADDRTPAQSRLPHGGGVGPARVVGDATHPAPQLRDACARSAHRRSRDPGSAEARQAQNDGALHAVRHRHALPRLAAACCSCPQRILISTDAFG